MVEALGERPDCDLAGLGRTSKSLPRQRSQVLDVDVEAVKGLIAAADTH
jgi:hypothetical protein